MPNPSLDVSLTTPPSTFVDRGVQPPHPSFDAHASELIYVVAPRYDEMLEVERLMRLEGNRDAIAAEAKRRALELARGEERLRFIQEAGRIGSWALDLVEMRLETSDGCKNNFGRSPHDPFPYEAWLGAIHADDRGRMQAAIEAAVAGQTNYDIEYRIRTPDAEVRWIQFRGHASYRADGTPQAIAGISLDINDRKTIEEHRDLLSKELSHRVKNTLAVIQSIAHQTLRRSASLKEAELSLDARIQSLAAAHDMLTRDSWDGATLPEVVSVALRPFGIEQERRFDVSGPILRLNSRVALAYAMTLHELATNAVKYGALSDESGHVRLTWGLVGDPTPDRVRFTWQETGGPSVPPPTHKGFGSRMIERALGSGIGGTVVVDHRPAGIIFTAETPWPDAS